MAEFLTTNGTSSQIENIIIEAEKQLTLVSPYLQISKTFYERLKDAADKDVSIRIVYGKDELKPNERNSLAELSTVQLFYFENLHAKCYFNENTMVITSMNMYEFSEKNNREMGVLIQRKEDLDLFTKAVNETNSIIRSAESIELKKEKRFFSNKQNGKKAKPSRGYCIRCEQRIDYDPERPYCWDCYTIWSQFENTDYQENVCHRCGEFDTTSMNYPQCRDCWKEYMEENGSIVSI